MPRGKKTEVAAQPAKKRNRVAISDELRDAMLVKKKLDELLAALPASGYETVGSMLRQIYPFLGQAMAKALVPEEYGPGDWVAPGQNVNAPERPVITNNVTVGSIPPHPAYIDNPMKPMRGEQFYRRLVTRAGDTYTTRHNPNGNITGICVGDDLPVTEDGWSTDMADYEMVLSQCPDKEEADLMGQLSAGMNG